MISRLRALQLTIVSLQFGFYVWKDNYPCGMTATLVETDCGNPAAGETSGIAQA